MLQELHGHADEHPGSHSQHGDARQSSEVESEKQLAVLQVLLCLHRCPSL